MEIQLTSEQMSAIDMVKNHFFCILTGGPGTGKTTTVRQILDWAEEVGLSVKLCAPTGKAAKRMMEATDRPASTIHALLGAMADNNGNFGFTYCEDHPLEADLLVVDEVSMVANDLMADLMRAVKEGETRVLLVGDQGQLPSVGAGAVLRDLLASGVIPHVELTQIHRNSGEIVRACHLIARGENYEPSFKLDLNAGLNLRHIEVASLIDIQNMIQTLFTRMADRGFDPVWDVQALSPVNSRGDLSCDALNTVLQDQLNPLGEGVEKIEHSVFRAGDKVIQIKNVKIDDVRGRPTFLVNGDMGRILDISNDHPKMVVRFSDPLREVSISKKKNDLLRAYCITCHRAQGSEAPVVIVPVHKTFQTIVTRNWIYTAISRAKTICFTVDQFSAIKSAIAKEEMSRRKTMLSQKITEAYLGDI